DHELVRRLMWEGQLPTLAALAGSGAFGPLRSTLPAFTPTAWSSFLTGMNPGGHGIFGFSTNPNRVQNRLDSAASRAGAPLWRLLGAGNIRSAFITVPVTYPPEPIDGIVVTGFGGPQYPEILPRPVANRILTSHPELMTAVAPTGWKGRSPELAESLIDHVGQIADVCVLAMEMEPELGLLCVDFMSSDIAGHLLWHRFDPEHPAHRDGDDGDELVQVYRAVDAACARLIDQAEFLYDEELTVFVVSDHGLRPAYWMFNANAWLEREGFLRFDPRAIARAKRRRADPRSVPDDEHLGPERVRRHRVIDRLRRKGDRSALPIVDFAATKAYCYGYGGLIYLSEANASRHDEALLQELHDGLASVPHPATGGPAFDVLRKEEVYSGPFMDRAPELIALPRDERIHVASTPRPAAEPFDVLEDLEIGGSWSGHHAVNGFLVASGSGIVRGSEPDGATFGQMASTLLALHGLDADLELPPIRSILEGAPEPVSVEAAPPAASDQDVFTPEQEAAIVAHLQALGYE
ncbi:MAG: alkaline phosphatase family protein, partial [Actinomycetota bacterium]|nr:alkaline phosphatase family protein [Actinomycetota bacterium]